MNKNIYFFWEGEFLPFLEYLSMASFRIQNPQWDIKLISKKNPGLRRWPTGEHKMPRARTKNFMGHLSDLKIEVLDFKETFPSISGMDPQMAFVHAKDMVNWHILANFGGIVSDTDILFIKPIDDLYSEFIRTKSTIGLISFINHPKKDYIPVSFMMGDKSQFFHETLESARSRYNPRIYECSGTPAIACDNVLDIERKYKEEFYRIDESRIFPFTHVGFVDSIELIYEDNARSKIPEDCIGLHWYGGNLNMDYNETNFTQFNNTLCEIVKEIVCQSHSSPSAAPRLLNQAF